MNLSRSQAALVAHMVRRIIAIWAIVTPDHVIAGTRWYPDARLAAIRLSDASGLSLNRCALIIAALSPRCNWRTNLAWAAKLIQAWADGEPCPAVSTNRNRATAWAIANGELSTLNGPKTSRFYANIMGNDHAVTVDVWAARIATGDWRRHPLKAGQYAEIPAPTGKRYLLIELAYQRAAETLGISPRELQAITWVAVRGSAN